MADKELKRITIQLDPELYKDLKRVVEHGYRRHILASLIRMAVNAVETEGEMMIGALMSGKFKVVMHDENRPNIGTN